MSKQTINCNKCGQEIHFDDSLRSNSGKKIPLQGKEGYDKHDCPNNPYKKSVEVFAKTVNEADKPVFTDKNQLTRIEDKIDNLIEEVHTYINKKTELEKALAQVSFTTGDKVE